jgi:hypothetical protein
LLWHTIFCTQSLKEKTRIIVLSARGTIYRCRCTQQSPILSEKRKRKGEHHSLREGYGIQLTKDYGRMYVTSVLVAISLMGNKTLGRLFMKTFLVIHRNPHQAQKMLLQ